MCFVCLYFLQASVIRMLENFISTNVFRDGLRVYLSRYAYKNASTEVILALCFALLCYLHSSQNMLWTYSPCFVCVCVCLRLLCIKVSVGI